jgi:hypothetical protein
MMTREFFPRSDEQTALARLRFHPALNNGCAATFENPLAGHSCDKQGSDIAKPGLLGLPGVVTLEWGPGPIRDV